jgi:hypothetical protein
VRGNDKDNVVYGASTYATLVRDRDSNTRDTWAGWRRAKTTRRRRVEPAGPEMGLPSEVRGQTEDPIAIIHGPRGPDPPAAPAGGGGWAPTGSFVSRRAVEREREPASVPVEPAGGAGLLVSTVPAVRMDEGTADLLVGLYPIVTSQYSSTT